jgi:predicted small metal-binding protein
MYELRCRDVGFECAGVVRGATRDEVLQQAAAHAVQVHGSVVTPALADQVRAATRQVEPASNGDSPLEVPGLPVDPQADRP